MEEARVKKKWSISKILLIIIASLFGVFAIVLIFTVNKELKAEERLIEMRDYILDTDDINMAIESEGEYAKIERVMKEYFEEYLTYYEEVEENDYIAVYDLITPYFLTYETHNIPRLLQGLSTYQEKAEHGIDGMIKLLDEEEIELRFIQADIDYYYLDFYKELMILDMDQETLSSWQDYKEENAEKMGYIKEMLNILNDYPDTWFVEDFTLYFSDDNLLREYNTYYDLLVEEDSLIEGIKM